MLSPDGFPGYGWGHAGCVGNSPENPSPRAGGEGQVSSAPLTGSVNEAAAAERGCASKSGSASTHLWSFSAH